MRNVPSPISTMTGLSRSAGNQRPVLMIRLIEGKVEEVLQDVRLVERLVAAARAQLSFKLVAKSVLPDCFGQDEKTATNIVASVLKETLKQEEYQQIAARNQEAGVKRGLSAGRKAAGIVEWPEPERARLAELALLHRHQSGRQKGRPDCEAIAIIINAEFHGGVPRRTRQATATILGQLYKEGLTLPADGEVDLHPWTEEEDARFVELMREIVHPAGHQHAGSPDFNLIAIALNDEFYPEQTDEGEGVRTGTICNKHAGLIRRRNRRQNAEGEVDGKLRPDGTA